jgi:cytidyltransferase-like protein
MKSFLDTIKEEQQGEKHHVITFGRMSPPTTGHLKLIDKVKEIAKKNNATHSIIVSHTQDSKKNPLSAEQKIKHLNVMLPVQYQRQQNLAIQTLWPHQKRNQQYYIMQ